MTTTAHTTDIEAFLEYLAGEFCAADTVRSYRSDLAVFGLWFEQSTGESLTAAGVTRNDQALSAYDEVRRKIEGADEHVFISQRTKRGITPRAVERLVAKYARLAGLEDVTPHVLRHSFGKDALGAGMDVVTVAALLGHENLKTTMIYTRPSEDELQVAIDRIGVA